MNNQSENSSNNKIIELKTVQTNSFKTLFESLKEILTDINLEFSKDGMKIISMDPRTQTILVHLKLEHDKFEYYYCKEKIIIGINLPNFFKAVKTITNNDTLTLYINMDNQNQIGIKIENSEKNYLTNYFLNLIEVDENKVEIVPPKFEYILTMPSNEFNKVCRDMLSFSDTIEIKSINSQIIFSCKGDIAEQETIMGEATNGLYYVKSTNNNNIIQGYYNLKHLVLFAKCTSMCNSITIYLKNSFPIVIEFAVGSLGELKLALAPKMMINDD
jgi:proliferating cell nuclear antigen